MKLCEDGHEEVCYEGRNCPACQLKAESESKGDEIDRLKEQIEELNNQE